MYINAVHFLGGGGCLFSSLLNCKQKKCVNPDSEKIGLMQPYFFFKLQTSDLTLVYPCLFSISDFSDRPIKKLFYIDIKITFCFIQHFYFEKKE